MKQAILKPSIKSELVNVKIKLPSDRLSLMKQYMQYTGFEDVDDFLPESRVEDTVVDAALAAGHTAGVRVPDEHEVQVRGVAELDAAELAVGADGKAGAVTHSRRLAIARHQGGPGHLEHLLEHDLGDEGQLVAHLHERQAAEAPRSRPRGARAPP